MTTHTILRERTLSTVVSLVKVDYNGHFYYEIAEIAELGKGAVTLLKQYAVDAEVAKEAINFVNDYAFSSRIDQTNGQIYNMRKHTGRW
jgi:hypothetical protein